MSQTSIPIRILVIDDDAMSRELLAFLLEGEGYSVVSADSGDAALNLLPQSAQAPDVVLTDLQMPGISGGQLADELRRVCGSGPLLLAMSGSQPPEGAISKFDGFLLKPFKVQQITDFLADRRQAAVADIPNPQTASKTAMESVYQSVSSATSSAPVLNETIYRQLAGTMPAPQLHEMYTMCLDDARERIDVMRGLAAQHDTARFVREAHAIKGSCGMLGATQLHWMAAELEKNGLEKPQAQAENEVNSLDELSAACDRLERMLGSRV